MAIIKVSDGDVGLFVPSDVYRYDTDNRPLRNLISNDQAINAELEAVRDEVVQARTGILTTYPSLDARLDDLELGAGLPVKAGLFHEFMRQADAQNARYASGFIQPLTDIYYKKALTTGTPQSWNPTLPDYQALPIGQILLHDENSNQANRVSMVPGVSCPVNLFVRGMLVQLYNEAGGATIAVPGTLPVQEITWQLPAAPASGTRADLLWIEVWLENVSRSTPVFYQNGAVGSLTSTITDPYDPRLSNTVGLYSGNGGDYFQVRHRLRVTAGVNPEKHQFGMSDPLVQAMVAGNSENGYRYRNSVRDEFSRTNDPGLWYAGNAEDLIPSGCIDGFSYAIPVALVFRRNTAQWTHSNQNGTKTSGGNGSWATGDSARPDGYYHDKIEAEDILLLAPCSVTGKTDLTRIADETFDRLLRGTLQTRHGNLRYDMAYGEDNFDGLATPVAGPIITSVNTISLEDAANTDHFWDVPPPSEGDVFYAPGVLNSKPDDFRRVYGAQAEEQAVGFSVDLNGASTTPANLITNVGGVLTLKSEGHTQGMLQSKIQAEPVMWWAGTYKPVAIVGGTWAGIGTTTATAELNNADPNYDAAGLIVGFVRVYFGPTTTGFKKQNLATAGQTYIEPTLEEHKAQVIEYAGSEKLKAPAGVVSDGTYIYVTDMESHKAWKLNAITKAVVASAGTYGGAGDGGAIFNQPTHIALDASGNVYIADTGNHAIKKLNSSMVYVGRFGSGAGSDNTHLNTPRGMAVDASGNVYIADYLNFRVVKLTAGLLYDSQFGVTGEQVADDAHCVGPKGVWVGPDDRIYVADTTRILVLLSDMTLVGVIQTGTGMPSTRTASVQAINPPGVIQIREDSSGNKYVISWFENPIPGRVTTCLTKYDSGWAFVARYGAAYDVGGQLMGGLNAGTADGLAYAAGMCLDPANDAIIVWENNFPTTSVTPALGQVAYWQQRVHVLKMSDLTVKYPVKYGYESGAATPYGPAYGNRPNSGYSNTLPYGAAWPLWEAGGIELDTVNRYAYITSGGDVDASYNRGGWSRIEKWAAPSADIGTWTFVTSFGVTERFGGINTGYGWRAWQSSAHDSTRINSVPGQQGMSLAPDGSAVFLTDNHSVIKLTATGANLTYAGRFGVAGVPGADNTHLSFPNHSGDPTHHAHWASNEYVGAGAGDSTARVYVADASNKRVVILRANSGWDTAGSPGARVTAFTNAAHFIDPFFQSLGFSYDGTKLWMRTWGDPQIPGAYEFDVSSSPVNYRDNPQFIDPGIGTIVSTYIPANLIPLPSDVSNNIMSVCIDDGILYWTDYGTNQIVAINLTDYRFIGEVGTPGLSGFDKANWNGPTQISVKSKKLYLADMRNGRVFLANQHLAEVQQRVGRVEFLIPPEIGSKWYGYSKHSAYQGVYLRGKPTGIVNSPQGFAEKYPDLNGRNVLTAPTKVLVTTLGRGPLDSLADPGIAAYANCIGKLPVPPNAGDETSCPPTDFSLKGNLIEDTAHYLLPVFATLSDYHGKSFGENESFWEPRTVIAHVSGQVGSRGGVQSYYQTTGAIWRPLTAIFPTVSTISCNNAPAYRYVVTPFLVTVDGEVLLAVRVQAVSSGTLKNVIGLTQNDAIELYRPVGHPMLKSFGS